MLLTQKRLYPPRQPLHLSVYGLLIGLAFWWGLSHLSNSILLQQIRPGPSLQHVYYLLMQPEFYWHIALSLKRVSVGLIGALVIGIPLGLVMGSSVLFRQTFMPLFQLLRMISPLSWMPIAVLTFGMGDAPIYFLLIFAAVWPVLMSTAHGVEHLNPQWRLLSQSLSATKSEYLRYVLLPAIRYDLLAGSRLALGVLWIVLVPCEMLGVNAGLGYFVLDTRDRMAYSELMATILIIGFLGYILDSACRYLLKR